MPQKKKTALLVSIAAIAVVIAAILWHAVSKPKRCAVFAGYNQNGTIAPYVITYLKALNEIAPNCVVYIADSPLLPQEEQKLKNLAIHTEHLRHNEYDWGSYKRGFNWLKQNGYLKNLTELVFANDSCYAPLGGTFKPMFEKMSECPELDFWGDSQNTAFNPHIQSYFMVFRKKVINSRAFAAFLNKVRRQEHSSLYITTYETALTPYLEKLGYKWDSFMPYQELATLPLPDKNSYPLTLIKQYNHQFLKRRTFTTDLAVMEDKAELLRYIAKRYPENYKEIAIEISPDFIPADLKE